MLDGRVIGYWRRGKSAVNDEGIENDLLVIVLVLGGVFLIHISVDVVPNDTRLVAVFVVARDVILARGWHDSLECIALFGAAFGVWTIAILLAITR